MKILYLGYWNLNDPLTVSTVIPNLRVLNDFPWITEVIFVNVQRESLTGWSKFKGLDKVIYRPYLSKTAGGFLLEKISDFVFMPRFLATLVKKHQIDTIVARGAPAGGLAYLTWKKTKTPFYVESLEPHADYMLESKVWRRYDPRYIIQRHLEVKQKTFASGLMPVAENYRQSLLKDQVVPEKIITVPCSVDDSRFAFSTEARAANRAELNIPIDAIVGVYAGRYGGLYLEEKAFEVYREAFRFFGEQLYILLLSPATHHSWITNQVKAFGLNAEKVVVRSVEHEAMPGYLAAADFALATYKQGESKRYLSPVKVAEYWASGLPVFITDGIGDENHIIHKHPYAGVLFNPERIKEDGNRLFRDLAGQIGHLRHAGSKITILATQYRNKENVTRAYEFFLRKE